MIADLPMSEKAPPKEAAPLIIDSQHVHQQQKKNFTKCSGKKFLLMLVCLPMCSSSKLPKIY